MLGNTPFLIPLYLLLRIQTLQVSRCHSFVCPWPLCHTSILFSFSCIRDLAFVFLSPASESSPLSASFSACCPSSCSPFQSLQFLIPYLQSAHGNESSNISCYELAIYSLDFKIDCRISRVFTFICLKAQLFLKWLDIPPLNPPYLYAPWPTSLTIPT